MNGIVAVANNSQTRVAVALRDVERGTCRGSRGRREKKIARPRAPGTAAVAQRNKETGSSTRTHATGLVARRRKKCSCSSRAAAREAGRQDSSTPERSFASSSPSSGQGSVAASTSVSAGSSRRLGRWRSRRARGNCSRRTAAHRSSPSTCMMISWPACSSLGTVAIGGGARVSVAHARARGRSRSRTPKGCSRSSSKKETGGTVNRGTSARIPEIEAAYAREERDDFHRVGIFSSALAAPERPGSLRRRVAQKVADAWCDSSRATMWRGGASARSRTRRRLKPDARAVQPRCVRGKGADLENQRTPRANAYRRRVPWRASQSGPQRLTRRR